MRIPQEYLPENHNQLHSSKKKKNKSWHWANTSILTGKEEDEESSENPIKKVLVRMEPVRSNSEELKGKPIESPA